MKKVRLFLLVALTAAWPQAAVAAFHYQGKLTDASGNPLNTPHNITVSIYDDPSAGTLLYTENHPGTPVVNGVFDVAVGSVTPLPATVFQGAVRYLEVSINGTRLLPRRPINGAPYALSAAANAVGSGELTADAVDTAALANATVTGDDVRDGAIGNAQVSATAAIPLSRLAADPSVAGAINQAANPVDWTRLKNVPASISDGIDAAGPTVALGGTTVVPQISSINFTGGGWTVANAGSGRAVVGLDPAVVTLAGNAFNAPNSLALLNGAGVLPAALGGTGANLSAAAAGSIPYFSATGAWGALPPSADGLALKMVAGRPAWAADETGPAGSVAGTGAGGSVPFWTGAGTTSNLSQTQVYQQANRIGLWTQTPDAALSIDNNLPVTLAGGGHLVVGSTTSRNLAFGRTSIQGRNAGAAAPILLNPHGGNVGVGLASNPLYPLHVNGGLGASGLCLSGDCRAAWPSIQALPSGADGFTILNSGGNWFATNTVQNDGSLIRVLSWPNGGTGERFGASEARLGPTAGVHMRVGAFGPFLRAIQAHNGGAASPLFLQPHGGRVGVGTDAPQHALDAARSVAVDQACIGADCRAAWPADAFPAQSVVLAHCTFENRTVNPGGSFILPFGEEVTDRLGEFTPGAGVFTPQAGGHYSVCVSVGNSGGFNRADVTLLLGGQRVLIGTSAPSMHMCTTRFIAAGTPVRVEVLLLPSAPAPDDFFLGTSSEHVSIHRVR